MRLVEEEARMREVSSFGKLYILFSAVILVCFAEAEEGFSFPSSPIPAGEFELLYGDPIVVLGKVIESAGGKGGGRQLEELVQVQLEVYKLVYSDLSGAQDSAILELQRRRGQDIRMPLTVVVEFQWVDVYEGYMSEEENRIFLLQYVPTSGEFYSDPRYDIDLQDSDRVDELVKERIRLSREWNRQFLK